MNSDIWTYITSRGMDLRKSGSNEKGLLKEDMQGLLQLLRQKNIRPLGLEVWRQRGENIFEMDSLATWVPSASADITALFAEADEIIQKKSLIGKTIFTLQF